MKNILVAYDGGEPARLALETGIELVKRFGGSLGIVSVIPMHTRPDPDRPLEWRSQTTISSWRTPAGTRRELGVFA